MLYSIHGVVKRGISVVKHNIYQRQAESWNYLRMSTDAGQEDSPQTQGQLTGQFIAEQQLPAWTRTYFDLAITGATVDKRPGIMTMLTDAEKVRPAYIVFYKLDRAFRNSYEQAAALKRLKKLGVKVLKVRDPNIEGPQGELIDTVLGGVNQFERELTGLRIRDHNLTMAQRGEWPGGTPPYGYRYRQPTVETHGRKRVVLEAGGLEPDPIEWTVARQIWDWAIAGYRKSEIVDLSNQAGHRRRNGGLWTAGEVLKLLRSRTYAGYVPYGLHSREHGRSRREDKAEWHPGRHQALVSIEEYARVQATTNSRIGQRHAHKRSRAELAGLIRCRLCGGPVTMGYDGSGSYYTCSHAAKRGAEHPYWNRREWVFHWALQSVIDHIVAALPATPPPGLGQAARESILRDIEGLRSQLRRQRTLFEVGEYNDDLDEYRRRKRELEMRIAAREADLATAGPSPEVLGQRWEVLRTWEQLYESAGNIQERKRAWALIVESIATDAGLLTVTLKDFGPLVDRTWAVDLPPPKTRRPGTVSGRGVVKKGYLARTEITPRPVQTVT